MNLDESEDKRRLFEYFIVAGLNDESANPPEELGTAQQLQQQQPCSSVMDESQHMHYSHEQLAPITDICVIFTSAGESTPSDFERIETTPQGYPANLNHGSLRSPAAFLCYKRGYHKPPLIDLGVLDEGKGEKPMVDAVILDKTPYGLTANISNSSSSLFFTTRRAKPDSPPHQLVVTNICVILENKGEHPPHTFFKIPKNLNKSMIGSEVYVCYKKSQLACKRIAYAPAVLDCFPRVPNIDDTLLVRNVPMFFLPMGALIEAWPERCRGTEHHARTVSTCVFTDQVYTKYYGSSITFYEPYTKPLSEEQLEKLDLGAGEETANDIDKKGQTGALSAAANREEQKPLYYCNKAICIVSRYPFFEPFRRFLFFLLNTTASSNSSKIPIERYISHLMYEVPFPSPVRPRVLVELGSDIIAFESSDDSQTPLTGANFVETLKCLGTENLLYAMLLTLLEQKILVHSLRPWLLTCVAETLCALMFPFSWNLPYIPQCPLPLAGVFNAPLSFMAGVDSRYFALYEEPPSDVTCFDLDTSTVSQSAVRKLYQLSMLPKKPLKRLRAALDTISTKIGEKQAKKGSTAGAKGGGMDYEQTHARRMQSELAIREAFLRFMCCLMDGYTDFLCPIMDSPWKKGATDVCKLFAWEQFMQSRDKNSMEFYAKFRETICFNRFIEERSGAIGGVDQDEPRDEELNDGNGSNAAYTVEDKSVYYVFFDDCIAKLRAEAASHAEADKYKNASQTTTRLLLDTDSMMANRTVVVPAPHLHNGEKYGDAFTYVSFPRHFNDTYFETECITRALQDRPIHRPADGMPVTSSGRQNLSLLRTRQEVRKAITDAAVLQQQYPTYWPRSVLFFAYTLWFMQLPALLAVSKNKHKMLLLGIRVLSRMEKVGVPFHDQVCYRLLMHLCGAYGRPEMAIIVLKRMLNIGIIPNAITYKVYHKALIQSEWPSELRLSAIAAWRRVQLRLDICARFRSMLPCHINVPEATCAQMLQNITTLSTTDTIALEDDDSRDYSNIVQEIVPMAIVEDTDSVAERQTHCNHFSVVGTNDAITTMETTKTPAMTNTNVLDPLGATEFVQTQNGTPLSRQHLQQQAPQKPRRAWEKQQQQSQQQPLSSSTPINQSAAAPPSVVEVGADGLNPSNNSCSLLMSPSREKFIRDHSASPLFAKEEEEADGKAAGDKRRRKSLRLGSSWLKSLANTSFNLIHRSQTTGLPENLDSVSRDGSVISDVRSASTSSAAIGSPSILSLANKMRKRAMKTYNEMVGQGVNELLERSGLNSPAQIFKEAKLNLSRSYRAADQSGLSTVSSSDDNLFGTDQTGTMDLFFMCAQRTRDPVSIHYWMNDVLPDEDTELRDVWLRHNAEPTSSNDEYLDVLVCSTSPCSNCDQLVYDNDLTAGWAVDDANLNTVCCHCHHTFLPSLKVCVQTRNEAKIIQSFTVPYISPLVLRRELETLVTNSSDGGLVLVRPGMRAAHPIIFWNLFYYCRRLELPTHLLTWISAAVVIHCVQDMPRLPSVTTEEKGQHQISRHKKSEIYVENSDL